MPEHSRPELRRTLKAALSVTGSLAGACAVAAVVAISPAQVPTASSVRPASIAPKTSVESTGIEKRRGTLQASARPASDRLDGLHADLARAVAMGHATPQQAERFEAEMAGYITGARQLPEQA
ncbi:hypothetical protein [Spelaeicoccus albus]|uniref:Uncharacterized protein n=1 Tax=Spelaeicoccus albus TaxID=1280376 RepID=A0A7Z0D2H3_9MICO|nr:hypothetical protein [Spelaeicoccus albus]NYI67636.1 hypothetical protein [Spelaeicoccus albus]